MDNNRFCRSALIIGNDNMNILAHKRIAVFGCGGVGSYVIEALARSGVGTLDIIDSDTVDISNINRQILALSSTVGRSKTEVMKERILDIDPDAVVNTHNIFFTPATEMDLSVYDYIIDAIDTVTAKIEIIKRASEANVGVISAMGAGNKIHPEMIEITDIYKTSVCPLAKVMRHELRALGIKHLNVAYSKEIPLTPREALAENGRRAIPGSISFMPSVMGLEIAGFVIRDILNLQ